MWFIPSIGVIGAAYALTAMAQLPPRGYARPTQAFDGPVKSVSADGRVIVVEASETWVASFADDTPDIAETTRIDERVLLYGLNTGKPVSPAVSAFLRRKLAGQPSVRVVPREPNAAGDLRADVFLPGEAVSINEQALRLRHIGKR